LRAESRSIAAWKRGTRWRAIDALAPGKVVLDIGAGSGLLAMLAARAGAAHVFACERNPQIAARCREIVAANGFADRITVLPVKSTELDPARDLDGGADLVVSEIFARDLLGEGVLPSLAHARAALCRPGARFLPERAALRVALADRPPPPPLGEVEGFDLRAFTAQIDPVVHFDGDDPRLSLRSDAADLFAFDFNAGWNMEDRAALTLASNGGGIGGVAQWLRIDCGAGAIYENAPRAHDPGHWGVGFYPLTAPRQTSPGEGVLVHGWHGESAIAIWADA
jgi:type III protein arginine methyltransferase